MTRPPIDGRWTAVLVVLAGSAALAVARTSMTAFVVLAVLALVGSAYAAFFWPRATIVAGAITTLLDPGVAVRLLPPSLADGPIGVSEPLLAVVGLAALTRVRHTGLMAAVRDPTLVLVAAFGAVCVLSALVNGTPFAIAVLGIVMTVDAVAIYFIWLALEPPPQVAPRAVAAIVAAGVVVALFGIGQVVLAPSLLGFDRIASLPGDIGQITSFVGNPNLLAPILGFLVPFPAYACLRLPGRRERLLAAVVAIVLVVALLLTGSRGAWIASGLGMVIGGAFLDWRVLIAGAGLAAAAAVLVATMPSHLVGTDAPTPAPSPVSTPSAPSTVPSATPVPTPSPVPTSTPVPTPTPVPDPHAGMTSQEIRLRFLSDGLRIARDHPLLGVGPGRYGGAAATIAGSPVYDEYGTTLGRFRTIHNFWLHLLAEVGVVGVSLFAAAIVVLIVRLGVAARRSDGARFVVLAGVATAAIIVGLNGLTEMVLEGNIPAILVWLLFAIGAALVPPNQRWILRRRHEDAADLDATG